MANTKILIDQNDERIKQIDQAYQAEKTILLDRVNNLMAKFSEFDSNLEEGTTTAKYEQLIENGPQSFITAAIDEIKDQFVNAGITSSTVLTVATRDTEQNGDILINHYNKLIEYPGLKSAYPELKFSLTDVKIVNGLAAVKSEKNLGDLKDRLARNFIDTEVGYQLVNKAEALKVLLNSVNDILRTNGQYNFKDLRDFADLVDFEFSGDPANAHLEINLSGIFHIANKIKASEN